MLAGLDPRYADVFKITLMLMGKDLLELGNRLRSDLVVDVVDTLE